MGFKKFKFHKLNQFKQTLMSINLKIIILFSLYIVFTASIFKVCAVELDIKSNKSKFGKSDNKKFYDYSKKEITADEGVLMGQKILIKINKTLRKNKKKR